MDAKDTYITEVTILFAIFFPSVFLSISRWACGMGRVLLIFCVKLYWNTGRSFMQIGNVDKVILMSSMPTTVEYVDQTFVSFMFVLHNLNLIPMKIQIKWPIEGIEYMSVFPISLFCHKNALKTFSTSST